MKKINLMINKQFKLGLGLCFIIQFTIVYSQTKKINRNLSLSLEKSGKNQPLF